MNLSALLRSLSCPRGRPMASDWEKTWQARAELYDLLDPPPAWDQCLVHEPWTPENPKPRTEGEPLWP